MCLSVLRTGSFSSWLLDKSPDGEQMCLYNKEALQEVYIRKGLYREYCMNEWLVACESLSVPYYNRAARLLRIKRMFNFLLSQRFRFLLDLREGLRQRGVDEERVKKFFTKKLISEQEYGAWVIVHQDYESNVAEDVIMRRDRSKKIVLTPDEVLMLYYSSQALKISHGSQKNVEKMNLDLELPDSAHERLNIFNNTP